MAKTQDIPIDEMLRRLEILKRRLEKGKERQAEGKRPFHLRSAFEDLAELFSEFKPVSKVIVFKEKHGDYMFDASTKQLQWAAAYEVVKQRYDQGYWYSHYTDIPEDPEPPRTPLEDAEDAEEPVAKAIRGMWSVYENKKKELNSLRDSAKRLEKALAGKGKDGSAMHFLEWQGRGEYEGYSIESLCKLSEVEA